MPKTAEASYNTSCRFLGHHFVLDAIFVAKIHGAQGLQNIRNCNIFAFTGEGT
jgi:hypothetical protein